MQSSERVADTKEDHGCAIVSQWMQQNMTHCYVADTNSLSEYSVDNAAMNESSHKLATRNAAAAQKTVRTTFCPCSALRSHGCVHHICKGALPRHSCTSRKGSCVQALDLGCKPAGQTVRRREGRAAASGGAHK